MSIGIANQLYCSPHSCDHHLVVSIHTPVVILKESGQRVKSGLLIIVDLVVAEARTPPLVVDNGLRSGKRPSL